MGMGPTEIFSKSIFSRPDSLEKAKTRRKAGKRLAGKPARMGQNGSYSGYW
jgi:hypothetical protein